MRLTVVLPFFNEEALLPHLPATFERIRTALAEHELRLLCIDDGSTDGTAVGLAALDGIERILKTGNSRSGSIIPGGEEAPATPSNIK